MAFLYAHNKPTHALPTPFKTLLKASEVVLAIFQEILH